MRQWARLRPAPPHRGPLHSGLRRFVFGFCVISTAWWVHPAIDSGVRAQETPAAGQRTVWEGVYTDGQAERGQVLYAESCSGCHAPDLRGDNTSPSLVGMSFTFLWGGSTLLALFERIQEQMPPDRPGTLSAQTYRDILAFVLHANSYPLGKQELRVDDLDQILIAASPDPQR